VVGDPVPPLAQVGAIRTTFGTITAAGGGSCHGAPSSGPGRVTRAHGRAGELVAAVERPELVVSAAAAIGEPPTAPGRGHRRRSARPHRDQPAILGADSPPPPPPLRRWRWRDQHTETCCGRCPDEACAAATTATTTYCGGSDPVVAGLAGSGGNACRAIAAVATTVGAAASGTSARSCLRAELAGPNTPAYRTRCRLGGSRSPPPRLVS
jgi:hypothetical protein